MLQVLGLDASDPLAIVDDFGPWFDERIKNDIAKKVDDRDACQSITFLREDSLTVKCQNLCLTA